ncbi:MAG: HEAT repeat domain-containing protein [Gemmataceae bacterium]|nr:HEAT repeat domain-containing protein [Gemmataceae bacterium]
MRIGPAGDDAIVKDVVPLLIDQVQEPASQGFVLGCLTTLGPKAKAAVPALCKTLKDMEWLGGKLDVIGSLGAIGPDARAAVPDLIELVKKEFADLGSVERERWIEIRNESASALGRIGADAKAAIPVLREMMKQDDSPLFRRRATEAIRLIEAATKP